MHNGQQRQNRRLTFLAVTMLFCSTALMQPIVSTAQTVDEKPQSTTSNLQARQTKYRSLIAQLAKIETQILELRKSNVQREFDELESTLVQLHAKRKRLADLERQWKLLSDGTPALEIAPRLNTTELTERQMLLDLESSKEKVLRLRTDLMRLKAEFGPGHPEILDTTRKLAELDSVVKEQTEALESLGVEVKSSIAKQKLKQALLRREELNAKFGSGHPQVINIESEIVMLEAEVSDTPTVATSHAGPSFELVNANLDLQNAASKFGRGHPVFKALKRKVEVLERLAQSAVETETPVNKQELAKRLSARIQFLQDKILQQETELDSARDKQKRLEAHEQRNAELLKKREELNLALDRFLLDLKPAIELEEDDRVRLSRQLLNGIAALEALGKSSEARRLREILSDLEQ